MEMRLNTREKRRVAKREQRTMREREREREREGGGGGALLFYNDVTSSP